MGKLSRRLFRAIATNWPGFQRFGYYSLFPLFFAAGFSLELFMVKFKFEGHNFYQTFNRRRLEQLKIDLEEQDLLKQQLTEELERLKKQHAGN